MTKKRIEYIEDGHWRQTLEPAFTNGFAGEGVSVVAREDFTELKADLKTGNLADVYILDNEITGKDEEGAEMALEICKRATELDRDVLVITMLCSNPDTVRKVYGDELDENGIPICCKLTDAAIIGFYIGRCLKEGTTIDFQEWLTSEGITMPENTKKTRDVQSEITSTLEYGAEPGGFYLRPREFIGQNREGITRFMRPESIRELDRLFPVSNGIEVKG